MISKKVKIRNEIGKGNVEHFIYAFVGASLTDRHKILRIPQNQIDLVGPEKLIQKLGF